MAKENENEKTDSMRYSYPIHTSSVIVVFRIIGIQLFVGFLSLLLTLPLIAFKEVITPYIPIIILYAFLSIGIQTINMILLVITFLQWIRMVYIIRPNEIIEQKGIWHIRENIYSTDKIEAVSVDQSIWGRIFNYGTIRIVNPVLNEDLFLEDISDPFTYADVIRQSKSKETIRFIPKPAFDSHGHTTSHLAF